MEQNSWCLKVTVTTAVSTSCGTGYGTFLFKFKEIVGFLLTPSESSEKSCVELTKGDPWFSDVVLGQIRDSLRMQYETQRWAKIWRTFTCFYHFSFYSCCWYSASVQQSLLGHGNIQWGLMAPSMLHETLHSSVLKFKHVSMLEVGG